MIFPVNGGAPYNACDTCVAGFGPARFQSPMIGWSSDDKWVALSLKMYGLQTPRSILLPYDGGQSLQAQWPNGIDSEAHPQANPGARVIDEGNVYAANGRGRYFAFRQTTQANLWKIPLPR